MQLFHEHDSKLLKPAFVFIFIFKNFSSCFTVFSKVVESHCERCKEPFVALEPQVTNHECRGFRAKGNFLFHGTAFLRLCDVTKTRLWHINVLRLHVESDLRWGRTEQRCSRVWLACSETVFWNCGYVLYGAMKWRICCSKEEPTLPTFTSVHNTLSTAETMNAINQLLT